MRPAPAALALGLLLAPLAQANALHFDDPQGDQAPFPAYLDIHAVDFVDDGLRLHVTVRMAEAPPGTPSTVFDILFESPTQGHNIGCFLGTSNPTEPGAGANCFAYRYAKDTPLGSTTDYRGVHFEQDRSNASLSWTFPLDTMAEEPGTELRLVRVLARLGISDDRSGDVAVGDPQDIASTPDAYVMPVIPVQEQPASSGPEQAPAQQEAGGLALLGMGAALALAAGARGRK